MGFTGSIPGMNIIGCVQTMYVEDHEFVEYGDPEMSIRCDGSYHQYGVSSLRLDPYHPGNR